MYDGPTEEAAGRAPAPGFSERELIQRGGSVRGGAVLTQSRQTPAGAIPRGLEIAAQSQLEIQKLLAHLTERLESVLIPHPPQPANLAQGGRDVPEGLQFLTVTQNGARVGSLIDVNLQIVQQLRDLHERLAL